MVAGGQFGPARTAGTNSRARNGGGRPTQSFPTTRQAVPRARNTLDPKLLQLATLAISHSIQSVLLVDDRPPYPKVADQFGLKAMLDVALESMCYPWTSLHVIPLLGSPTLRCWDVALKRLDLLNFVPTEFQERYEVQADYPDRS